MDQRIGKYEVLRRIGEGSSSVVWLCRDSFANRKVAVKVAKPEALRDPRHSHIYAKLFSVEAHLAGKLHHPHVAEIYDAADEGDLKYTVIEYVPDGTLERFCRPDRLLPIDKVVEVMFKCSRALDYAHRLGITHRDIKPANILIVEENGEVRDVKITDFGTAMNIAEDTTIVAGIGSPAYMSPEQIAEGTLTHQTDIYSLGVVMYQLLTGHLPFEAPNNAAMVYQVLHTEAPPARTRRPELPEALERIVQRAMNKNLKVRYATWEEFATDLAEASRTSPTRPRPHAKWPIPSATTCSSGCAFSKASTTCCAGRWCGSPTGCAPRLRMCCSPTAKRVRISSSWPKVRYVSRAKAGCSTSSKPANAWARWVFSANSATAARSPARRPCAAPM